MAVQKPASQILDSNGKLQHVLIPACALGPELLERFLAENPNWCRRSDVSSSTEDENNGSICASCFLCSKASAPQDISSPFSRINPLEDEAANQKIAMVVNSNVNMKPSDSSTSNTPVEKPKHVQQQTIKSGNVSFDASGEAIRYEDLALKDSQHTRKQPRINESEVLTHISEPQAAVPSKLHHISEPQAAVPSKLHHISEPQVAVPSKHHNISEPQAAVPSKHHQYIATVVNSNVNAKTSDPSTSNTLLQKPNHVQQQMIKSGNVPVDASGEAIRYEDLALKDSQHTRKQPRIHESACHSKASEVLTRISVPQAAVPSKTHQQIAVLNSNVNMKPSDPSTSNTPVEKAKHVQQQIVKAGNVPFDASGEVSRYEDLALKDSQHTRKQLRIHESEVLTHISEPQEAVPLKLNHMSEPQAAVPLKHHNISEPQAALPSKHHNISEPQAALPSKHHNISVPQATVPSKLHHISEPQAALPSKHHNISKPQAALPSKLHHIPEAQAALPSKLQHISEAQPSLPSKHHNISQPQAALPLKVHHISEPQAALPLKVHYISEPQDALPLKVHHISEPQAALPSKVHHISEPPAAFPSSGSSSTIKNAFPCSQMKTFHMVKSSQPQAAIIGTTPSMSYVSNKKDAIPCSQIKMFHMVRSDYPHAAIMGMPPSRSYVANNSQKVGDSTVSHEQAMFDYIVATRKIPQGYSLATLDRRMRKKLMGHFKSYSPPCPHCNCNTFVKFRYFNNSTKSTLLQPRYGCRNPDTCLIVQEETGKAICREFTLPKSQNEKLKTSSPRVFRNRSQQKANDPQKKVLGQPQMIAIIGSKRSADELDSVTEASEMNSNLPNTTLSLQSSNG